MAKKRKKYLLSTVNLPNNQLKIIYNLQSELFRILSHDLENNFGAIVLNKDILDGDLDDLEIASKKKKLSKDDTKTIKSMRETSKAINNVIDVIGLKLKLYLDIFDLTNYIDPLISKPFDIINEIKDQNKMLELKITRASLKSLEIVYPYNILFGILSELVNNAIKHGPKHSMVLISWKMRGKRFECQVHDNGYGILPNSYRGYASPDILESMFDINLRKAHGIRILNRIIRLSSGKLLFSRSNLLRGTSVYFDFPVFTYKWRGRKA
ncbi:sensor histidine kinase [Candidatus Parcubacteria bacterium]|nr:MAG: sensor histidine kinase [Candidatus Parcubacteria bacterium]